MKTLRIVIAALALIAFVAGLLIPQPEVYAISGIAAIVIFLLGCALVARGLAQWSSAAAWVFLGAVGMTIGAWPYLTTFGKRTP